MTIDYIIDALSFIREKYGDMDVVGEKDGDKIGLHLTVDDKGNKLRIYSHRAEE